MISRTSAVFVCSLILATVVSGDYPQPPLAGLIQQESVPQNRDPALAIITLCWDGTDFSDECLKRSTFLRQFLNQLVHKLKTESRRRHQTMKEPTIPARKRQDETSGFYSNW